MRCLLKSLTLAAVALSGTMFSFSSQAKTEAAYDGTWSVLIITEKGTCDRGYRYNVQISDGQLKYQGSAPVGFAGKVAEDGLVKVSIHMGDKGANGNGRLSAIRGAGTGTWSSANLNCAGRWEAERL